MSSQHTLHPCLLSACRRKPLRAMLVLGAVVGFGLACSRPASTANPGETVSERLTSRPRTPPPPTPTLAIGASIRTGPSEHRRVALPGGSVLYINEDSEVELQAEGQLKHDLGEVFVEAGPR